MEKLQSEIIFAKTGRPVVIGSAGEIVEQTTTTMDLAVQKAAEGIPDGYVVAAEKQTGGRGRKGAWESGPAKSILISIILRAGFRKSERMLIGIMGAVAAAEAVQTAGVKAQLKWPNDIVVENSEPGAERLKKLGGVLVEQFSRNDAAPAHVLGIGINVNQNGSQLPENTHYTPTSLKIELNKPVNRNHFCVYLLRQLDKWYKTIKLGKKEALLAQWKNLSCLINKKITVKHKGEIFEGEVLGLSAGGELILMRRTGKTYYLSDESVQILGL